MTPRQLRRPPARRAGVLVAAAAGPGGHSSTENGAGMLAMYRSTEQVAVSQVAQPSGGVAGGTTTALTRTSTAVAVR